MSVFSAFVVLGTVMSMEGPLSYDLQECEERIGISEWRLDLMFQTPSIVEAVKKKFPNIKREDLQLVCVEVNKSPEK